MEWPRLSCLDVKVWDVWSFGRLVGHDWVEWLDSDLGKASEWIPFHRPEIVLQRLLPEEWKLTRDLVHVDDLRPWWRIICWSDIRSDWAEADTTRNPGRIDLSCRSISMDTKQGTISWLQMLSLALILMYARTYPTATDANLNSSQAATTHVRVGIKESRGRLSITLINFFHNLVPCQSLFVTMQGRPCDQWLTWQEANEKTPKNSVGKKWLIGPSMRPWSRQVTEAQVAAGHELACKLSRNVCNAAGSATRTV